jgi:hypothetical protein
LPSKWLIVIPCEKLSIGKNRRIILILIIQ